MRPAIVTVLATIGAGVAGALVGLGAVVGAIYADLAWTRIRNRRRSGGQR